MAARGLSLSVPAGGEGSAWLKTALATLRGSFPRTVQGPVTVSPESHVPVRPLPRVPPKLLPSQGPSHKQLSPLGAGTNSQPPPHHPGSDTLGWAPF